MEILKTIQELSILIGEVTLIVMALVGITKQFKSVSKQTLPLFAIGYGISLMFIFGEAWQVSIIAGIISSLSAMGLYSGSKAFIGK